MLTVDEQHYLTCFKTDFQVIDKLNRKKVAWIKIENHFLMALGQ